MINAPAQQVKERKNKEIEKCLAHTGITNHTSYTC